MEFLNPESLLPHMGEMILIGPVLDHDDLNTTCFFMWDANSPFSDKQGRMPLAISIEVAAQAVGIQTGLNQVQESDAFKVGFLIALKHVQLPEEPLPAGKEFRVHVEQFYYDQNYGIFNVKIVDLQDLIYFSGQLKFFQPNQNVL